MRKNAYLLILLIAWTAPAAQAFEYALIGPSGGNFKSVEYIKAGMLLAGGFNGRLYISSNYGKKWKDITPVDLTRGMVVEKISYHTPTDTIYLIVRDLKRGLLIRATRRECLDGLNKPDVMLPEMPIRSLVLSEDNPPRIFVGTDERLHYSLNGGRSWKSAPAQMLNPQVESLAIDPEHPDTIFAGSWQRAYKTTDFGKNWKPIHSGMAPDSDVFALFFDDRKRFWAGTCGHAYRSDTPGAQWVKKRIGLKGKRIHCLEQADGDGGGDVLAGTDNGLHLFRDAADAWMQIVPDVAVQDITRDETGALYFATEGAGILRYQFDPPRTESVNMGLNASSPHAITGSPDSTLWVGLMYQGAQSGLWQYNKDKWSKILFGNKCRGINIRDCISTATYLFAASSDGLLRFELDVHGVKTGEYEHFLKNKTIKTLFLESDGVTLLAGTFDGLYQVNTDYGSQVPYVGMAGININCIWKCPSTGLLLVGAEGALYRLEQGSAKWKLSELPASVARINRIAGTIDGSQIYLATSHGAMASYDNGKRFTRSTGNLPDIQCLDLCVEEEGQVVVLLGDHSVYFRQINAYKWEHLITLPFDAWSLHTLANSDVLCIGTPANGVVLVPKNVD